ncbi:helix-turn-helix domain-containing protein [Bosea sp. 117]|uniref:methylation-associated defense system helix-turn-helix domain-containing protein MAD1 n=1 Tax=Bosea sp. 117 TaxID=1125973 RepID=UPI0009DF17F1|nr:helix-turn-helix domain-containing protein [Bosea sp. 117]
MPDEILTLPEVASLLKVAEKTVYTMAQRAEIPAFKVRGQWRFKRIDLDRWIEAQKVALNPSAAQSEPKPSDLKAARRGRQDDH